MGRKCYAFRKGSFMLHSLVVSEAKMNREGIFQGLGQLRKSFFWVIGVVVLMGALLYPFSRTLLRYLKASLQEDLIAFSVPEAFLSLLKLTLYASLFFSIPVIFYQLWKSFSPWLRMKGLTLTLPILLASIFLFYLGAFFCYFVTLPFGIRFLLGYQSAHIKPMISAGKYISFCTGFVFAFGIIFELPLILAVLSTIRLVTAAFLTRNRRYAILLIAILSAVLTPTPDFFNMTLMGGPLYILFEVGVLLVKMIERRRMGVDVSLQGK
jgi:sec-independent protein translocase protein TatC